MKAGFLRERQIIVGIYFKTKMEKQDVKSIYYAKIVNLSHSGDVHKFIHGEHVITSH